MQPVRVTKGDEAVRVSIRQEASDTQPLAGKQPVAPIVKALLGDKESPVAIEPAGSREFTAVLSPNWQPGINRMAITATDAAGNAETRELIVLMRPVPTHPITVSKDGAYLDAGKRIFPLGIYQVSPAAMPTVKKAGIDVVHSYEFESARDDVKARAYLDAAAAAGLRVFIGFDRGITSKKGLMQANFAHVIDRVAALCDNPGPVLLVSVRRAGIVAPIHFAARADGLRRFDPPLGPVPRRGRDNVGPAHGPVPPQFRRSLEPGLLHAAEGGRNARRSSAAARARYADHLHRPLLLQRGARGAAKWPTDGPCQVPGPMEPG